MQQSNSSHNYSNNHNNNSNKVPVVVVGYGYLGRFHAQKVGQIDNSYLVGVIDPSDDRRKLAQQEFPHIKTFDSIENATKNNLMFDAAIVASPTSMHFSLIKKLFELKKHILCEKPICSSKEEIVEIEQIIAENNKNNKSDKKLVLQVGHSERFHQAFDILVEMNGGSALKDIGLVLFNRLAPYKPRALDVDVVQDLMIHDIDLLLHLFSEKPSKISASGQKFVSDSWDFVTAAFEFPSGRKAQLRAHRDYVKTQREIEIINSSGSYLVDLFLNEIHFTERGFIEFHKISPDAKKITYPKRDHLLIEQKAFYNAILDGNGKSIISFEEGVAALKIAFEVLKSVESSFNFSTYQH
ncbi:MAG: Gfo/Idh/MocA family oxidoreductase [Oligoflexia bacterium]|nr:Gfo/Idh/MocA family oxidoreductase [Oligoflexia bacterium]